MKKDDAKRAFRQMFSDWAAETDQPMTPEAHPSYSAFRAWTSDKGYSQYFDFRSETRPDEDVEQWFDEYFKQT